MCVIVHQPPTATLDLDRVKRLWDRNSDGGGFAFINPQNGKINVQKAMELEQWWHRYSSARGRAPGSPFLVHFRIATHGEVSLDNTHPFWVNQHTVMAHNGILSGYGNRAVSDTKQFIEDMIECLPKNWLDNPQIRKLVANYIGKGNKLMFLTNAPYLEHQTYIINEEMGIHEDNMWFSNSWGVRSYPILPAKQTTTPHKQGNVVPLATAKPGHKKEYQYAWDWDEWEDPYSVSSRYWAERDKESERSLGSISDNSDKEEVTGMDVLDYIHFDLGADASTLVQTRAMQVGAMRINTLLPNLKDIRYLKNRFWCSGCNEEISEYTGRCECENLVCDTCFYFLPLCDCAAPEPTEITQWLLQANSADFAEWLELNPEALTNSAVDQFAQTD